MTDLKSNEELALDDLNMALDRQANFWQEKACVDLYTDSEGSTNFVSYNYWIYKDNHYISRLVDYDIILIDKQEIDSRICIIILLSLLLSLIII